MKSKKIKLRTVARDGVTWQEETRKPKSTETYHWCPGCNTQYIVDNICSECSCLRYSTKLCETCYPKGSLVRAVFQYIGSEYALMLNIKQRLNIPLKTIRKIFSVIKSEGKG